MNIKLLNSNQVTLEVGDIVWIYDNSDKKSFTYLIAQDEKNKYKIVTLNNSNIWEEIYDSIEDLLEDIIENTGYTEFKIFKKDNIDLILS